MTTRSPWRRARAPRGASRPLSRRYRALRGHVTHYELTEASHTELLAFDRLPETFTLHFLGPVRGLKHLRKVVRRSAESVANAKANNYKHHRQVDLPVARQRVLRQCTPRAEIDSSTRVARRPTRPP